MSLKLFALKNMKSEEHEVGKHYRNNKIMSLKLFALKNMKWESTIETIK